jgi:phosphohistidine phosphatase
MAYYLVQHGLSQPKEIDPRKGLSEEGRRQVERIAQLVRDEAVAVSVIQHSGKQRALQTAELFAAKLNPPGGVAAVQGIAPLDDVEAFAGQVDLTSGTMLVGHLPFLERLISLLITGNPGTPVFKLQNGGILCLDQHPESGLPVIRWALMPTVG